MDLEGHLAQVREHREKWQALEVERTEGRRKGGRGGGGRQSVAGPPSFPPSLLPSNNAFTAGKSSSPTTMDSTMKPAPSYRDGRC
ncbi:hypothetical protein NGA_0688000 [Nannochloropsis gaditana CCMP526]|uniref:uncharacterized protein n=1 Tax=Nannochloropsis gaditana (strain CCMP526) TaxID=1093141 RepID=UPI00029F706A|nr:hypothetical protein NGA_0688000 [Nannochloropsis gaditana CCMP526]EKU23054.1 hypothetical protein NGA_0688000 [Nannochloropsis gaditana CCMP526]|eukprot:XP_005852779.1 hypothetical protein NGA_0688000 [Nannochloropsis gaditana CCMP526]